MHMVPSDNVAKCSRCTECTQCTVSGTLRRSNLIREQKRGGGTAAKCNKQVVEEEKLAEGKRERKRGGDEILEATKVQLAQLFTLPRGASLISSQI